MPTIKDVANLANVSTATVSRVINTPQEVTNETKLRVEQAIIDLKYIPNANARQLVKEDKLMIGVVLSELANPFNATFVHGIEQYAQQLKIKVLISTGTKSKGKAIQAIRRLQADGCRSIIVYNEALTDAALLELSKVVNGLVVLNRYIPDIANHCISFDNQAGAELATNHLLENGHKNIAIISSSNNALDANTRLEGIKTAFKNNQTPFPDKNVVYGENSFWGGYNCAERLLNTVETFSAIICFNDTMAIGVISKLKQENMEVPNQISVIGFDDLIIAKNCTPALTTIRYPINNMAKKAVEVAWNIISQQKSLSQTGYQYFPILKVRSSTQANISVNL